MVLGSNGQFTITASTNPAAIQNVNNGSNDNCGGAVTLSFTSMGFTDGQPTNVTPTRTYNCADIPNGQQSAIVNTTLFVMDQYGNQSSCVSQVTVVDNTAPALTCPATQVLARNAGCSVVIPNYITSLPISATDICGNPVYNNNNTGIGTISQNPAPGTIIGAGGNQNITVTITAQDVHTNISTCTFNVDLRDVTPPSFNGTCPNSQNLNSSAGFCSTSASWTVPSPIDNCSPINLQGPITMTAVATGTTTPPNLSAAQYTTPGQNVSATFFVGTTTVTYTATDAAGNSATCVFTVTVTDNTPPVITNCATLQSGIGANNTNVSTGAANCTYTHSGSAWDATATDNCLLAINPYSYSLSGATTTVGFVTANTLNGVVFNRGVTTVTWRATDFSGNIATCDFQVVVTDNVPPVFGGPGAGGCLNNLTFVANTAGCTYTAPAAQTAVAISDNCGITLFEWDVSGATPVASGTSPVGPTAGLPNNFVFSLGVSNVQYRIRDAQGNIVTCTFTVTVQNNVQGTVRVGAPPAVSTSAAQNAATTSTVTFTGSGSGAPAGTQQYQFTYSVSVNGGAFGAPQTATTAVGSNVTTVAQSNASVGTYAYRLDNVVDLSTGCTGTVPAPNTATINVVTGSDLTPVYSVYQTLSFPATGSQNNFGLSIINIGATPSAGQVILRIPKTSAFTLAMPNVATLSGNPVNNNNWTLDATNASFWIFTMNAGVVIPAGGANTIGITVTRNAGVAPNTSQPMSVGIQSGSGGDATPANNTATVQLTAQ